MVLLPLGGLENLRRRQVSHLSSQKVLCSGLGTEIIFLGSPFTKIPMPTVVIAKVDKIGKK